MFSCRLDFDWFLKQLKCEEVKHDRLDRVKRLSVRQRNLTGSYFPTFHGRVHSDRWSRGTKTLGTRLYTNWTTRSPFTITNRPRYLFLSTTIVRISNYYDDITYLIVFSVLFTCLLDMVRRNFMCISHRIKAPATFIFVFGLLTSGF